MNLKAGKTPPSIPRCCFISVQWRGTFEKRALGTSGLFEFLCNQYSSSFGVGPRSEAIPLTLSLAWIVVVEGVFVLAVDSLLLHCYLYWSAGAPQSKIIFFYFWLCFTYLDLDPL